MHWATPLFLSEFSFLFGAPALILPPLQQRHTTLRLIVVILRVSLIWVWLLLQSQVTVLAFSLLGAVLLLLAIEYKLVVDDTIPFDRVAFAVGHLSLIAYVLDLPGLAVRQMSWSHFLIVTVNVTFTTTVFMWYFVSLDYTNAWGCYPDHTEIKDLSGGTCLDQDRPPVPCRVEERAEQSHAHNCDLFGYCEYYNPDVINFNCTIPASRPRTRALLNPLWHLAVHALVFNLAIYFGSIPGRIRCLLKKS